MTSRPQKIATIAVVVVILAFATGVVLRKKPPVQGGQAISGYTLRSYPTGWHPVPTAASIEGLPLSDPIMVAPAGARRGTGLIAGRLPNAPGLTPLPPRFLDTLDRAPQGELVRLGGLEAFRYSRLRQRDSPTTLTLYILPGWTSTVAVACVAPATGPAAFMNGCDRVVATVLPSEGTTSSDLRPDPAYARRVDAAIDRLSRTRVVERTRLRRRATSVGQAAVAKRLARAYRRATGRIDRARPPEVAQAANDAIATGLRRTARAYADLASEADLNRKAAYLRARRRVQIGEVEVQEALGVLAVLGYRRGPVVAVQR